MKKVCEECEASFEARDRRRRFCYRCLPAVVEIGRLEYQRRWGELNGRGERSYYAIHADRWRRDHVTDVEARNAARRLDPAAAQASRERVNAANTKHGLHGHPVYITWKSMRKRCEDPNDDSYPRYGGRGIRVCERWSGPDGIVKFVADMGDRPGRDYDLHRIDNDGDYEPGNVEWLQRDEHRQLHVKKRHGAGATPSAMQIR